MVSSFIENVICIYNSECSFYWMGQSLFYKIQYGVRYDFWGIFSSIFDLCFKREAKFLLIFNSLQKYLLKKNSFFFAAKCICRTFAIQFF